MRQGRRGASDTAAVHQYVILSEAKDLCRFLLFGVLERTRTNNEILRFAQDDSQDVRNDQLLGEVVEPAACLFSFIPLAVRKSSAQADRWQRSA